VRVVITGASSGIGEALARHYAKEAGALALIARRPVDAKSFSEKAVSYSVDVTDQPALAAAAQDFIHRFGAPDLVIANAGIGTGTEGADVAAFRGLAGNGAYCASKSAVVTWMESMRAELYGSGVSVVCVCPGYIDTPMTRVNRYRMPFLMSADEAARRIARVIARKRRLAVIPWQMALISVLLRLIPGWLYDRVASRAPRKPRNVAV
jgi:short-subunit dehydrogenase